MTDSLLRAIYDIVDSYDIFGIFGALDDIRSEELNPVNKDLKRVYRRFKPLHYKYELSIKPLNKVFPRVKLYHRKIL